eukprot:265642-Rhodomonas_salina.1
MPGSDLADQERESTSAFSTAPRASRSAAPAYLLDLPQLAKYLHTTPTAIRQLNPDIMDDEEEIGAFKRVCVLPEVCGPECGNAAYCSRTALYGNAPALV